MAENTTKTNSGKVKLGDRIKNFVKEYKHEFKKITWPTVRDTNKSFVLVLVATAIVGVAVFALDLGFNALINLLV